ncbi:N-acetylglucosamine-6-phosphate deacetylase [Microlunatus elymi]|uniref:N-acetylglucosamine-6-phosphate deacetylase n=1 Tax=Microlunatus elymi TaxID=2596828 RepID=A0A516Q6C4_9ACTN|nr:N-acetylglucosamine-6-phosphate deacetylase [Microlunatus elymi]
MLIIDGSRIQAVEPYVPDQERSTELINGWVLPGFVDTHTHGGGGDDLATEDPDAVRRVAAFARSHGSTSIFASLVTASLDTLEDQLRTLSPLLVAGEIAGIHLEGPFLSAAKRGAHDPDLLQVPDPSAVDRLLTAADGRISMITIAPELPGALDAVRRFVAAGVTVAIGHTTADDRVTLDALDAGATVVTHLFNAMPSIHHRKPGPVPVLLTDPRATVELICDGVHLHPEIARMAIRTAGPDRVALITDAMVATGMSDGDYRLGGLDVRVSDGVARLQTTDGSEGSIAGSTLTMQGAVAFCVQTLGLPIADVATMAATTPARTHGLDDVGRLESGKRADLAVVDDQGNLLQVMAGGQWQSEWQRRKDEV